MSQPTPNKTRSIVLTSYIQKGTPDQKYFKMIEKNIPELQNGQILVKLDYLSVDPYMRGRMTGKKSYVDPFVGGEPIQGPVVGRVVGSKSAKFKEGETVGFLGEWSEYQARDAEHTRKMLPNVDPETALSVVGMTGLAAYFGMLQIAEVKAGNVVLITGAAGAVGYVAGAIAKMKGCTVIGICGSEEKVKFLVNDVRFDTAINYKQERHLAEAISRAAPKGIDVFFDNTGGPTADFVRPLMNHGGRIVQCGIISAYNAEDPGQGPRWEHLLVAKSLKAQGFTVQDYHAQFDDALKQLSQWYNEGKIPKRVTVRKGFGNAPQAFIDLFHGENIGKMLVQL